MIKYLGSKRLLAPLIGRVVEHVHRERSVIDLFSGTARVGHALKGRGFRVLANDHNAYAAMLARCYVQADHDQVHAEARRLIEEMNRLPGRPGYVTETFCRQSRFFMPHNGERIDAIREAIAAKALAPELEAVMLTALMEAADRIDSTTGVQMAYLKQWAPRAANALQLRMPAVLSQPSAGKGHACQMEAIDAVETLEADVAYLDPPYNQHKYLGNYHIWETLARWDKPAVYGSACKRTDVRERSSDFNSKPRALAALEAVVQRVRARTLIVSFNDEGYIDRATMEAMLSRRGHVQTLTRPYHRYVGARIGIHNPGGEKVGRVSHLDNHEFLYVVTPEPVELHGIGESSNEPATLFGEATAG